MKTVQMTLDAELVAEVDKIVKGLKTTRSSFTRSALRSAIRDLKIRQMEENHRKGYEKHPPNTDEFTIWEDEQVWGD